MKTAQHHSLQPSPTGGTPTTHPSSLIGSAVGGMETSGSRAQTRWLPSEGVVIPAFPPHAGHTSSQKDSSVRPASNHGDRGCPAGSYQPSQARRQAVHDEHLRPLRGARRLRQMCDHPRLLHWPADRDSRVTFFGRSCLPIQTPKTASSRLCLRFHIRTGLYGDNADPSSGVTTVRAARAEEPGQSGFDLTAVSLPETNLRAMFQCRLPRALLHGLLLRCGGFAPPQRPPPPIWRLGALQHDTCDILARLIAMRQPMIAGENMAKMPKER